jgi:enediyne biosynthesis protein E8
MQPEPSELAESETMTLEAFADTIIPGERRSPDDRAVAGAATGGGAVASGAVDLMTSPEGGLAEMLESLVAGLNDHAQAYALAHGVRSDESVPAFVALPFTDRTALAQELMRPGHPEQDLWVALAMFSNMAWDTGASMHTTEAIERGHPGLTIMGFAPPDPDGLWRFPNFSYRRALADIHPSTTPQGDPA